MRKECKKCNIAKNEIYFHKDKTSKDGLYRWCKACKKEYDTQYRKAYNERPEVEEHYRSEEFRERKRKEWINTYARKFYNKSVHMARDKGLECNVTEEDFVLPELCPIMGTPLVYRIGEGKKYWDSPSLDRIDNSKGYIKGNVWIISRLANTMKFTATTKQLKTFSTNILKLINNGTEFG